MKLTPEQTLIVTMLAGIYKKLDIDDGIDPDFILECLSSENLWALTWEYPGIFHESSTPDHVKHVADVLEMWEAIEESADRLSAPDRARVETEAAPFANDLRWRGFDGNREGEYLSAARIMIKHMGRFSRFSERRDLNSHMPTYDVDRRMLLAFEPIAERIRGDRLLNADELIQVLKARKYEAA